MTSNLTAEQFLNEKLNNQKSSLDLYDFNGQKVWIKKASRHNPMWLYRLVGLGFWVLGLGVLRPVPSLGGKKAISTEVKRLQTLKKNGINVPPLLAYDENGLMTTDLGTPTKAARQLDSTMRDSQDDEHCRKLFTQASDAIFELHQRHCWLSEGFARNIMIDGDDKIAFLDFETEPHDILPIEHCMARDWLFFMFSMALRLKEHDLLAFGGRYLQQIIAKEPSQVRQAVLTACKKLTFFKNLPVDKIGGDGRRLVAMSELFSLL